MINQIMWYLKKYYWQWLPWYTSPELAKEKYLHISMSLLIQIIVDFIYYIHAWAVLLKVILDTSV